MADKSVKKTPKVSDSTPSSDVVDAKTTKTEADSQRKRRVLRPAAEPTTLREQGVQARAKSGQSSKTGRVVSVLTAPFRFIGTFIARILRPLGKFRAVRAIGYVLAPPYIRNSWKELKQVEWPDRTQTRRLTFAVVLFSLVFGSIVAGVDYGLDKLFRAFILNR